MKCPNCGNEIDGKFCTNCGTPAPVQNDGASANPVPEQQPQDFQAQPYETSQNAQTNQTSYGQQFTNAQGGYEGQQFTNNGQPPKKSSSAKIAVIIVSVVVGLVIILGIIFGIVACNVVKEISSGASDVYDHISNYVDDYSSEISDIIDDYSSDLESAFGEKKYDKASRFYYEDSTEFDGLKITGYEMDYDIYDDAKINITVPSQINGKNVVEIEEIHAYYDDAYVTVTIPGTVKVIRGYSMSFVDEFDEVIIEDGVEIIEENALIGNDELKKITVPASVKQMDECGIGCEVDDDYNDVPMKDAVIYGKKGSVAEAYAKHWGIKFVEK